MNKAEPNNKDIKESLKFLGVKDENELDATIENNWYKSYCTRCGRVIDLQTCAWNDGDPVCGECYHYG